MSESYEGSCLCGGTRYRVSGAARVGFCHCRSCRLASGAPSVAWAIFDKSTFSVSKGELAFFRSSPGVRRGSCDTCGTAISFETEARPHDMDLTLATIEDPGDLTPECHVWVSHKLPWMTISDGLPQFAEDPDPEN